MKHASSRQREKKSAEKADHFTFQQNNSSLKLKLGEADEAESKMCLEIKEELSLELTCEIPLQPKERTPTFNKTGGKAAKAANHLHGHHRSISTDFFESKSGDFLK